MIRECRLTNFIILSLSFSLDFLECTGGTLSMIQVVCDSWNMHDITGITGDLAKFALGFATILFDVSLVYCSYFSGLFLLEFLVFHELQLIGTLDAPVLPLLYI